MIYQLINKIKIVSLSAMSACVRSNVSGIKRTDQRQLIFDSNKIINDMPTNYFDLKQDDVDIIRARYMNVYTLNDHK